MNRIPVRELNRNTAGVLARVERGEALEITRRGRPVAWLLPVSTRDPITLVAAGRDKDAR